MASAHNHVDIDEERERKDIPSHLSQNNQASACHRRNGQRRPRSPTDDGVKTQSPRTITRKKWNASLNEKHKNPSQRAWEIERPMGD